MAEIRYKDLNVDDLFNFCEILNAIGVEQIIEAFDAEEITALQSTGKDANSIGITMAMKMGGILVKNLSRARNEVCSFFAGCMEWDNGKQVTAEELRRFKIARFLRLVKEFFEKEDLVDFFEGVAELLGSE